METRTGTSAIEFSGIVNAVGPDATNLVPGDRVVVLAPHSFRTTERVPAWSCQKMLPDEDFEVSIADLFAKSLHLVLFWFPS